VIGEVLELVLLVVVREDHGVALALEPADLGLELVGRQRGGCVEVGRRRTADDGAHDRKMTVHGEVLPRRFDGVGVRERCAAVAEMPPAAQALRAGWCRLNALTLTWRLP
jgi:hypothetical protein